MTPLDLGDLRSDIAFQHENNRDIVVSSRRLRVLVPKSDRQEEGFEGFKPLEWKVTIMPDTEGDDSETLPIHSYARSQLLSLLNFGDHTFNGILTQGTEIERKAVDLFLNTLLTVRKFDLSLHIVAREWDDPIIANITTPDDKGIDNYDLIENIVPLLNLLQKQGHNVQVTPDADTGLADDGTLLIQVLNKSINYKINNVPFYLGVTISNEPSGTGLRIGSYIYDSHNKIRHGTALISEDLSKSHMIEVCEVLRDSLTNKKAHQAFAMRMAKQLKHNVKTKENSKRGKAGPKAGRKKERGNTPVARKTQPKHAATAKGQRGSNHNSRGPRPTSKPVLATP